MIAKGKNASELFPAVVKNVASKNIEVLFALLFLLLLSCKPTTYLPLLWKSMHLNSLTFYYGKMSEVLILVKYTNKWV